jgi:hypothetical protein
LTKAFGRKSTVTDADASDSTVSPIILLAAVGFFLLCTSQIAHDGKTSSPVFSSPGEVRGCRFQISANVGCHCPFSLWRGDFFLPELESYGFLTFTLSRVFF